MFVKYFENGYVPIPVFQLGKNPAIKTDWTKYCKERPPVELIEEWESEYPKRGWNIGITCGQASGIVVLDIDTDDEKIINLCPPSPVRRRGAKGEARFFKYSQDIISQSFPGLDIMSDGRQILVPPSIHPTTRRPYVWLTPDTIESVQPGDLPSLDLSFLKELLPKLTSVRAIAGGRNNKLVDVVTAMRGRGETESKIVKEVYEWDRLYHSPRLFLDPSENYKAKTEEEAKKASWEFVSSVTRSLIQKGVAVLDEASEPVIVIDDGARPDQFKPKEFQAPGGLLGDIQQLIIDESVRVMPNIALGGALALLGALISNRFRFGSTWSNIYIMNLAPTGAGKSFPQSVIKTILAERLNSPLMGFGDYRSSAALVKNLVSRRERLDVIDEISMLFAQMKDGGIYQNEIQQTLCKLWSESNQLFLSAEYAEKQDTSTCYNPCVSILGSSTIDGIKEKINKSMTVGGLLPRFLIFSHEEYGEFKEQIGNKELLDRVSDMCGLVYKIPKRQTNGGADLRNGPIYDPIDLSPKDAATIQYVREINKHYTLALEKEDEAIKHFYTRAMEQIKKLALIHCVGCAREDNLIQKEDVEWARNTFETCLHNSRFLLEESQSEDRLSADRAKLVNMFKREGFLSRRQIMRAFHRRYPKEVDQLVEKLTLEEMIHPVKKLRKNKHGHVDGWALATVTAVSPAAW